MWQVTDYMSQNGLKETKYGFLGRGGHTISAEIRPSPDFVMKMNIFERQIDEILPKPKSSTDRINPQEESADTLRNATYNLVNSKPQKRKTH